MLACGTEKLRQLNCSLRVFCKHSSSLISESPTDDSSYTKIVFEKLKTLIDLGFERKYLKDIWNIQKEILQLKLFENDQHSEITIEIVCF